MTQPAYRAGITAALAAELAFLIVTTAVAMIQRTDPWLPSRMAGSLIIGPAAIAPPGFVLTDVMIGIGLHAGMAIVVGMLYALLLPRFRVSPIVGGVITGMVLYVFGFFGLPLLFPRWLAPFRLPASGKITQAVAHLFYGFVFGWTYQQRTQ